MAARNRKPVTGTYVSGNTVRITGPAEYRTGSARPRYDQRQTQQEARRRRMVNYAVRRNQEKALQMNLPYVVVLTIAAMCVLSICVNYLHVQSSISARIYHIEQLEKQLEQYKAENDALATRINTDIDLEHIYKVATEELGMVYANKNQVLLYDKTESEYVRQYEDIPRY